MPLRELLSKQYLVEESCEEGANGPNSRYYARIQASLETEGEGSEHHKLDGDVVEAITELAK